MVDADAVRRVGLTLPRTYEAFIGGRWKLKVRQLVYVAFSRDETSMGFGYPRDGRDDLVASDPDTFFLPPTSDLRYQWVCARLTRLDEAEMRELVIDAWRMCVPQMLHDLPEQPDPVAAAWWAIDEMRWDDLRPLLHPYLHWMDRHGEVRGRSKVLGHLRDVPTPKPPAHVQIRHGQVYRWSV
jgi:hypothetical protein